MTVISEYAETPMRPVYKHLHISIGISGKTHGIKDKHKHRCFQEINTIPYAIYAHFVLLPFCEYWVLHEEKQETSLWGHFNIKMAVAWQE